MSAPSGIDCIEMGQWANFIFVPNLERQLTKIKSSNRSIGRIQVTGNISQPLDSSISFQDSGLKFNTQFVIFFWKPSGIDSDGETIKWVNANLVVSNRIDPALRRALMDPHA